MLDLAKSLGITSLVAAVQETLEELEANSIVHRSPSAKRSYSSDLESPMDMSLPVEPSPPPKKKKLPVPLLQSILTNIPATQPQPEPENAGKLESDIWRLFSERAGVLPGLGNQNNQLANLLSAAAKLKQVANKAMRKFKKKSLKSLNSKLSIFGDNI